MAKKKKLKNSTEPAIAVDTVLGTGLIRSIMESTGRFEFIVENEILNTISFWDNHWEKEYHIGNNWTLKKLIGWITNLYAEDFEYRGVSKAQNDMRKALGL